MKSAQFILAFAFATTALADNLLYPYVDLYGVKVPLTGEWHRQDKVYTRARENLPFPNGFVYENKHLITVTEGKNATLCRGGQDIMTSASHEEYPKLKIEFDKDMRVFNIPLYKCVYDGTKAWNRVYITLADKTKNKVFCESANVYFLYEKPTLIVPTNDSRKNRQKIN